MPVASQTIILLLRHLLAIAALPFTVLVVVPVVIARTCGIHPETAGGAGPLSAQVLGAALCLAGLALAGSSVRRFAREGRGTLAPWDPPRNFVVNGPYRYVRNPMISGVILALFGEALVLLSLPHAAWAASFLALNFTYIPLVEEPQLARRFGEPYLLYCRNVRRFVPRATPWRPRV